MKIVLLVSLAFVLCLALHAIALKLFVQWNLLDFPDRYGHKRRRLPYPSGILAVLVFLCIYSALSGWNTQVIGVVLGIILLAVVSFIDDRRNVSPWLRLLTQVLVAILIFSTGTQIYTLTNPLSGFFGFGNLIKLDTLDIPAQFIILNSQFSIPFGPLPFWSGIFTIFWLLLTINALNWFDGIPGQVSILSCIGFGIIGFLSLSDRVQQPELALLAFILSAIALGCFLFDMPPPRVLMGDTGAMFFGLMLGVLTIYAGGKVATAFLVLGVPLIDSIIVAVSRVARGLSPLKSHGSHEHLHHRLVARGWSERHVIALTATLGLLFGTAALFLNTLEKFIAAVLLFICMIILHWYSQER